MSRMLEALKQIEARSAAAHKTDESQACQTIEPPPGPVPVGPASADARAYGELADNLLSQLRADHPAAWMFTSPGDGAGKTSLLVSLAPALLERTGGELLLVDANLRKPELAGLLGVQSTRGLAEVLMGVAPWRDLVRKTVVQRLSVLPGTKFPTAGGRTPQRLNLAPLLEEFKSEYRLVLLDSASLAYPEVAPMGRWCDGIYLVVRLRQTPRRGVLEAVRVIEDFRGPLLGCVVTTGE